MPMTYVDLRVPIGDAIEWEPWLTEALSIGADESKVGYDGGEEEGRFESHLFLDADAETVKALAQRVLDDKGLSRQVLVTSDHEVTVFDQGPSQDWLVPVRLEASNRKLKDACRKFNASHVLGEWLRRGGDARFLFSVGPVDGWNFQRPRGGEARDGDIYVMAPSSDLHEILAHLAEYLGRPLPEIPDL
jgi:hypothetical protein